MGTQKEERSVAEKSFIVFENINHYEQTVKGDAGEGSEGHEERVVGNWRKRCVCYRLAGSLAELFPTVTQKSES